MAELKRATSESVGPIDSAALTAEPVTRLAIASIPLGSAGAGAIALPVRFISRANDSAQTIMIANRTPISEPTTAPPM